MQLVLVLTLLAFLAGCQPAAVRPDIAVGAAPATSAGTGAASAGAPVATLTPESTEAETSPEAAPVQETPIVAESLLVAPVPLRGADVFARINRGLSPNSCAAGSNSERWRERYASSPAALATRIENILPLLDFVSAEVERAGLPSEFVFIPLVESWYQPGAIGSGGPAGMWQMISSTARNHGIHIQSGYDGRLSPVESTRAALSYLKTLQGMFGGWESIVMAYNAGEGRMMRAFARSENRNVSATQRRPHGLSNITYDYVAKLQALSCLVSEPSRNGLSLPVATQFVPLSPILMNAETRTLEQFAASQGTDAGELRRLNPGYKGGKIVAGVPRLVLTPSGLRSSPNPSLTQNAAAPASAGAPSTHQVRAGESLWSIAHRYNLSIEQLRRVNRLGGGTVVRPGQTLKLPP